MDNNFWKYSSLHSKHKREGGGEGEGGDERKMEDWRLIHSVSTLFIHRDCKQLYTYVAKLSLQLELKTI